jgi:hypothetical protein
MPQRDPDQYTQGDDGLIVEKVGSWAIEKVSSAAKSPTFDF